MTAPARKLSGTNGKNILKMSYMANVYIAFMSLLGAHPPRAGSVMPIYVRRIVKATASNTLRMILLMSSRSMPAKTLNKNNSKIGNAVEMDQKANPTKMPPLRNTCSIIDALVTLQAMTTKMVFGFFQDISSDVAVDVYP